MLGARHPADGTTLDAANIRNQIITFLIAGHETTSGTLSFALHYLAKNPTVLRLVQREADELWGDSPDPEPSFEDIGRLTYTRQVLNETLRLWPSAPAFGRQARHDTVLGGRIPMRAGRRRPCSSRCCTAARCGATTRSCSIPRASPRKPRRHAARTPSSRSAPENARASDGSSR
ncbi:cytochrome P450 [Saccharopolyspora spinosporotrichia]